jgi:hypothetical protein
MVVSPILSVKNPAAAPWFKRFRQKSRRQNLSALWPLDFQAISFLALEDDGSQPVSWNFAVEKIGDFDLVWPRRASFFHFL